MADETVVTDGDTKDCKVNNVSKDSRKPFDPIPDRSKEREAPDITRSALIGGTQVIAPTACKIKEDTYSVVLDSALTIDAMSEEAAGRMGYYRVTEPVPDKKYQI